MKIPNSTSSSHLVISECILARNQLQGVPQIENSGTRAFLIARGDAALPHRAACGVPATSSQLIIETSKFILAAHSQRRYAGRKIRCSATGRSEGIRRRQPTSGGCGSRQDHSCSAYAESKRRLAFPDPAA